MPSKERANSELRMPGETAASIRTRAELARRIATELTEPNAVAALNEIADALDVEADRLECNVVQINKAARRRADLKPGPR